MGPLGRKKQGLRLVTLLFWLDVIAQGRGLCAVTEEAGITLEEETTAAPSITGNTAEKDRGRVRTPGSVTSQARLLEQLDAQQVTTDKLLAEAQRAFTTDDSRSVSSKAGKEALNPTTAVETTTPSDAAFMNTTRLAHYSTLPGPSKDTGSTHALQDASGTSTLADSSPSAMPNTTRTAMPGGRGLIRTGSEGGILGLTTSASKSHSINKETEITIESKMSVSKGSETPSVLPGSEIPDITTGGPQRKASDSATDVDKSSASNTPETKTSPSPRSSPPSKIHWYIIAAAVVLATLILILCFVWNVRRRRNTGSTSFQNPSKKKRKAGEDAWAGPVQMPEENAMSGDVVENEQDPSGKRLTLTTFFNKRKSQPPSVVLEEVTVQPVKSTKDEASPLLNRKANGQVNGNANVSQGNQNTSLTSKESSNSSEEQELPPPPKVQGSPPAQTADEEVLPPPPSPPPGTDLPAPPPSPEMQTSQTTV